MSPQLWTRLQPVPADAELRACGFLALLAVRLPSGPAGDLLRLLQTKHAEVGRALNVGKEALNQCLLSGLEERRSLPPSRGSICSICKRRMSNALSGSLESLHAKLAHGVSTREIYNLHQYLGL